MVKDINASTMGSKPYPLGVINNELFFRADENTHGLELWKTDGTSNGTTLGKGYQTGYPRFRPISTDWSSMELFTLGPMMVHMDKNYGKQTVL